MKNKAAGSILVQLPLWTCVVFILGAYRGKEHGIPFIRNDQSFLSVCPVSHPCGAVCESGCSVPSPAGGVSLSQVGLSDV